ncbi:hypothetical protein HY251_06655 [bacterium]|nr:hypothetical protein [bacterium]
MVALGRAAAAFELHLNPTKTRIEPLPQPLGSDWVEIVRSFSLGSGASQRGRMIEFFDAVVGLRRDHPDQLVVEYAMGKLAELRRIERTSWPVVQSILLQLIAVDPSSIRHGLRILQRGVRARWRLDQDETERVLNRIVVEGVRRSHDYEVTWALWGLLVFRLEVSDDAARCLGTSEDSCTALLALAARDQGLLGTPAALCTTVWESQLTQAGLSGPMWLLAYEATVQGFLVPPAGDHLAARPAFRFLRQKRVRFLDRVTRSSRIRRLRRRSPADVVS